MLPLKKLACTATTFVTLLGLFGCGAARPEAKMSTGKAAAAAQHDTSFSLQALSGGVIDTMLAPAPRLASYAAQKQAFDAKAAALLALPKESRKAKVLAQKAALKVALAKSRADQLAAVAARRKGGKGK
jgi:hypothetical protein